MPQQLQPRNEPVLELSAVGCERDDRVLFRNLDLSLDAGAALQVRGANGTGKTTLLRCIAGLHPDYSGTIRRAGAALFIGHRPGISASLTAAENLLWHQQLCGLRPEPGAMAAALERVGLPGWEDVPCVQMSAGQQRRVALARLVLPGARVPLWLLDEPFTALDDAGFALIVELMGEHLAGGGALVFATHQPVAGLPGQRTLRIEPGAVVLEAA